MDALDATFESKGARDRAEFIVERAMQSYVKAFNKAPDQEGIDFFDRYKTGKPQPTPELQGLADTIRAIDTATFDEAAKQDVSPEWKENHLRVMWKIVPGSDQAKAGILDRFNALSKKDQTAFKTAFSSGNPQSTPELQKIADMMNATGITPDWKAPRMNEPGVIPPGQGNRNMQGSKGMMQHSTLPDMSTGLKLGGIPFTYNPAIAFKMAQVDLQKLISVRRIIARLRDLGRLTWEAGEHPVRPEGSEWLSDSISRNFAPIQPGGMGAKGRWAIQKDVARVLNNHVSRDLVRESAAGRGLMWIKNVTTSMELSFSPFHAVAETLEVGASSIGLGLQKIVNGGMAGDVSRMVDGVKDLAKGLLIGVPASTERAKLGTAMMDYISKEDFKNTPEGKAFLKSFPNAASLMDDLFAGGAKLANSQDWKVGAAQSFTNALHQDNYIGAALRAVPALSESLMKPLFDHYIPRLKLGTWLKEYTNALVENEGSLRNGTITRSALARQVWQSVENRLGEMNYDNLFWNRTFKSGMQLMFRSVTWKSGSLGQYYNALVRQGKEFMDAARGIPPGGNPPGTPPPKGFGPGGIFQGKPRAPRLMAEMGWLFGLALLTAAMATVMQKLLAGKDPESLTDLAFPQIDPKDPKVRVGIPSYIKDAVHLWHSPSGYITSSTSGWIGRMVELWNNHNFYGVQIRDHQDNAAKQALDMGKHVASTLLPFSVSGYRRLSQQEVSQTRRLLSFVGMNPAPNYMSQSKAESTAAEINKGRMGDVTVTQQQFERRMTKSGLVQQLRRGDRSHIQEDIRQGLIKPSDLKTIQKRALMTPLQAQINSMSIDQVKQVAKVATPQEMLQIRPILARKTANAAKKAGAGSSLMWSGF